MYCCFFLFVWFFTPEYQKNSHKQLCIQSLKKGGKKILACCLLIISLHNVLHGRKYLTTCSNIPLWDINITDQKTNSAMSTCWPQHSLVLTCPRIRKKPNLLPERDFFFFFLFLENIENKAISIQFPFTTQQPF